MTVGTGNGGQSPTAPRQTYYSDMRVYRIPGRDADKGEITHKLWGDLNRKERRAVRSAEGHRLNRYPQTA
jgi:hypothetical protein